MASFARDSVLAGPSGVPYLFLHFPEGDTLNRETLTNSLEFARREARRRLSDTAVAVCCCFVFDFWCSFVCIFVCCFVIFAFVFSSFALYFVTLLCFASLCFHCVYVLAARVEAAH